MNNPIASTAGNIIQPHGLAKQLTKLAEAAVVVNPKPRIKYRSVKVICPATSANLGPGFDIFALALSEPYDTIQVTLAGDSVSFRITGPYASDVPEIPEDNVAGFVASHMLATFGIDTGLKVKIRKRIRPGGGMGSSAASAMAMACAIDRLFDLRLCDTDLIEWGALGEMLSGGVPHVDNVSAAYLGGFVVVTRREPLSVIRYDPHPSLYAVLIVPEIEKKNTRAAREAVGPRIAMTKAEAMLALQEACGIITGRVDAIMEATRDLTHIEAKRESEGFYHLLTECKAIGSDFHAGVAGSGAGPSIIALTTRRFARPLSTVMEKLFKDRGIPCRAIVTRPSVKGIKHLVTPIRG
jgi:homoserine kinase